MNPIVIAILNKYNSNMPEAIFIQSFNEYITEVAKMAELKDKITITRPGGGVKQESSTTKYVLIYLFFFF